MRQKKCNFYEVYEGDKLVTSGFKSDVAFSLGITESGVDTAQRHGYRVNGKYYIVYVGKKMKYYDTDRNPVSIVKRKETFVERYFDLERHGTTIMSADEYKRHQELIEDKGYHVRYTRVKRGRQKAYYLLEVI